MGFDKTPRPGAEKHTDTSEASNKEKKKKRPGKKRLSAPVPLEVITGQEKALKSKKAKKKTKSSPETTAVPREAENASSEPTTAEKPSSKKDRKERTPFMAGVSPEEELVSDQKPELDERTHGAEIPKEADEPFAEKVILPHETDEEEGELFISDRLQKELSKEPDSLTVDPEQDLSDDEVDEDEEPVAPPATATASPQPTARRPIAAPPVGASGAGFGTGGAAGGRRAASPTGTGGGPPYAPTPPYTGQPGFGGGPAAANLAPAAYTAPAAANRGPEGNRRAERRNLVAGIILGGVIEHIRHKRREKRMKKTHEKEIKTLKKEQQFQQGEQYRAEQKAKRTKTTLERQIERLNQSLSKEKETVRQNEATKDNTRKEKTPQQPENRSTFYEEYKQKFRNPETATASRQDLGTPEKPAQVPKQAEVSDEPLEVPSDRRVETSAWHRIEIDKKTGKAVEDPTLAYGEEFQNEQHQEQLRRQIAEASMESEQVKKSYMPMVDKTANTMVETHDPPRRPAASQKIEPASPVNSAFHSIRDKAADSNGVDIILWVVFFFIVIAIIALL